MGIPKLQLQLQAPNTIFTVYAKLRKKQASKRARRDETRRDETKPEKRNASSKNRPLSRKPRVGKDERQGEGENKRRRASVRISGKTKMGEDIPERHEPGMNERKKVGYGVRMCGVGVRWEGEGIIRVIITVSKKKTQTQPPKIT